MSDKGQKAAIITGGSHGAGAGLVTAYRRQGWSVVATARTMKPAKDPLADAPTHKQIFGRGIPEADDSPHPV